MSKTEMKLKAYRPRLQNYPQTPPDNGHRRMSETDDSHFCFKLEGNYLPLLHKQRNKRMDRLTDGCYEVHYLPASLSYMVDN